MIVSQNLRVRHIFHISWPSLLYFTLLSISVYLLHHQLDVGIALPFNGVATLSAALAIYLGFKANQSYDRWWEGRKIWGLLVNYSRGFAREILTFPESEQADDAEIKAWQRRLLRRHVAFVHGLRVFLRTPNGYVQRGEYLLQPENTYTDLRDFLSENEFEQVIELKNLPNQLLLHQGEDLHLAKRRGWLSDYRFVQMSTTLTEFNNHQGKAERIKNTPLPRPFSFYSRVFVYLHGTLVPFAFIEELTWLNIPLSITINFVFLSLDLVGQFIEDPFENRTTDVPLTAISLTIEDNLREMARETMPVRAMEQKPRPVEGVVF